MHADQVGSARDVSGSNESLGLCNSQKYDLERETTIQADGEVNASNILVRQRVLRRWMPGTGNKQLECIVDDYNYSSQLCLKGKSFPYKRATIMLWLNNPSRKGVQ